MVHITSSLLQISPKRIIFCEGALQGSGIWSGDPQRMPLCLTGACPPGVILTSEKFVGETREEMEEEGRGLSPLFIFGVKNKKIWHFFCALIFLELRGYI